MNRPLGVSVSIGVALFPGYADDAAWLPTKVHAAMYQTKQLGKNRLQLAGSQVQPTF
ncbi:MAG: hypothetical protein ABJB17_01505 [Burkholderiales bacterium]